MAAEVLSLDVAVEAGRVEWAGGRADGSQLVEKRHKLGLRVNNDRLDRGGHGTVNSTVDTQVRGRYDAVRDRGVVKDKKFVEQAMACVW